MIARLKELRKLHFRPIKTIWFNLKVFKFHDALRLPVFLFGYIGFEDLHRGCVRLDNISTCALKLGGGAFTAFMGHSNLYKTYIRLAGTLYCGTGVTIDQGCIVSVCKGAELRLGSNIYINRKTKIHAKKSIIIDDNCRIGWDCQVFDTNFHYTVLNGKIMNRDKPVYIGHNVWLTNGVSIMKGSALPPFSVVASRSLINKDYSDIGEGWLFGGVPAKPLVQGIRRLLSGESYLESIFGEERRDCVFYEDIKGFLN